MSQGDAHPFRQPRDEESRKAGRDNGDEGSGWRGRPRHRPSIFPMPDNSSRPDTHAWELCLYSVGADNPYGTRRGSVGHST
ncbi:hypothetical protein BD311DRAFT_750619 [Dichomitus squalens]|uniref:Uncharacterized protein n=1 Tax=Dichomitus squalens TaxID=114155 RepID=A0A4Q9MW17_9APHY|nr:hypothetical protein BD311DRAFT_750619 [Dichomitus squalens]